MDKRRSIQSTAIFSVNIINTIFGFILTQFNNLYLIQIILSIFITLISYFYISKSNNCHFPFVIFSICYQVCLCIVDSVILFFSICEIIMLFIILCQFIPRKCCTMKHCTIKCNNTTHPTNYNNTVLRRIVITQIQPTNLRRINPDQIFPININPVVNINIECSICFENYISNNLIEKLNCGHCFHKSCIIQWTKHNRSCPLCRVAITDCII